MFSEPHEVSCPSGGLLGGQVWLRCVASSHGGCHPGAAEEVGSASSPGHLKSQFFTGKCLHNLKILGRFFHEIFQKSPLLKIFDTIWVGAFPVISFAM